LEDKEMSRRIFAGDLMAVAALTLAIGCGPRVGTSKAEATTEHGAHGTGPHGGAVADWGGGKYHVEFKPDHDKKEATVWILASDEKTPVPIKAKDGQISASITGLRTKDSFEMELKADPQKGEPEGKASRFTGNHEKLGVEQEFAGTITGVVDGTPYSGDFKEEPEKPTKK
jgi:hypothetical protein